jgi:hypothetical protein
MAGPFRRHKIGFCLFPLQRKQPSHRGEPFLLQRILLEQRIGVRNPILTRFTLAKE